MMRALVRIAACVAACAAVASAQNGTVNPANVYTEADFGSASTTGRYTANIVYGGQTYVVQLDTGSSDFVLASTACTNCLTSQKQYPLTGINTGCSASTKYGSGSTSYNVYLDSATLAGASSTGQNIAVGAMTSESGSFRTPTSDGLLGLAYPQISEIYQKCGKLPVTDELVQTGVIQNAFGLCFKIDQSGGIFALGCAQVEGLTFTPIKQTGYYTVTVTSVAYGDQQFVPEPSFQPILDSGTTLLIIPNAIYNDIVPLVCQQLATLGYDSTCNGNVLGQNVFTMTQSDVNSFPNITITMTNNAQLVVSPLSYWVKLGGGNEGSYQFGLQGSSSEFIIGDVALQGHYLFFDKGNYQVGILVAQDCDVSKATLTGTCANAVVSGSSSGASTATPARWHLMALAVMAGAILFM